MLAEGMVNKKAKRHQNATARTSCPTRKEEFQLPVATEWEVRWTHFSKDAIESRYILG